MDGRKITLLFLIRYTFGLFLVIILRANRGRKKRKANKRKKRMGNRKLKRIDDIHFGCDNFRFCFIYIEDPSS